MNSPEDKLKELLLANTEMLMPSDNDGTVPINRFRNWFLQQFDETKGDVFCKLDDFAIYFLNSIRQLAETHLRTVEIEHNYQIFTKTVQSTATNNEIDKSINHVECNTPKRYSLYTQNSAPSTPNFASTPEKVDQTKDSIADKELLPVTNRNTSRNASFANITSRQSADRSLTNTFKIDTSTPIRRNQNNNRRSGSNSLSLTATPHNNDKLKRNTSVSSSFCLGDFMVVQQNNNRSSRKKLVGASPNELNLNSNIKPKKRVVPTTISQRSILNDEGDVKRFGCSSSFSNENNILKLTNIEIEDKNKCSILAARKSLKLNANKISKELETVSLGDEEKNLREMFERKLIHVATNLENETSKDTFDKQLPSVDFDKIKNHKIIQCLADIYVILMDLNFVTNVLSEMAFVLNLLNAQETVTNENINKDSELVIGIELLSNVTNCIYFALCTIRRQRYMFAQLDLKSLGVVLNNERIQYLDMDLKSYLEDIHNQKQSMILGKSHSFEAFTSKENSFKSVYYQEDKDSRQHFTSNNDFGAFRTQRDLFYNILKLWETHHLNPNWNFTQELAPKIREIFKHSENPINMAHFAKLFVSQLLISASDASSPEDIGLDVDAEKFSKLTQRLVAPSNFSVDYQFPRNQAFFRDFIAEARSIPFIEQLKMALYHQLIILNNSTFEQLNLFNEQKDTNEFEAQNDKSELSEFIVRPDILASMMIIAKFLGFITAYPYSQNFNNSGTLIGTIVKKQLNLRSLFQPHFSVYSHLLEAMKNNKMLITLPWLVQYLAMLDNITLQMEDFENATQLLFKIYCEIGFNLLTSSLLPLSIFIIRCCMGWLFDTKPIIADKFFMYRSLYNKRSFERKQLEMDDSLTKFRSIFCRKTSGHHTSLILISKQDLQLHSILECLLPVACPFLAEFRVAIMPIKYATTKYVSRTGRYRHITTRLAEPDHPTVNSTLPPSVHNTYLNSTNSHETLQNKLIDAFLHSQNTSMRRLIEFVSERVFKSVVKDGQYKYIVPSKAAADKSINEITSSNADEVLKIVSTIYTNAHQDALQQWENNLHELLNERIAIALRGLLPVETTPIIQKIYFKLIKQYAMKRVQQWFDDNLQRKNFYCGELKEIAQKICKVNKKESQVSSRSELKIIQMEPCISDLLDELQYWLHCSSVRTEVLEIAPDRLIKFFKRIPEVFVNTLPTIFYRLIGTGIIQLMQHLIIHKPEWLTSEMFDSISEIWLHPEFVAYVNTGEQSRKTPNVNESDDDSYNSNLTNKKRTPSIYDGLITISFIEALGECSERFEKLKDLLVYLIKNQVFTSDMVDILFMPIFKANCSPMVLNEISKTLQLTSDETTLVRQNRNTGTDHNSDDNDEDFSKELLARDVDNLSFY